MKLKKQLAFCLSAIMAAGTVFPAFAANPQNGEDWFTHNENAGTDSDMHVSLIVENRTAPVIFSAYVPAAITVAVSRNGNVITPENLRIINGVKTVPIGVWDMKVTTTNGWELVPWKTDLKTDPSLVDTKKIAMTMNDMDLSGSGFVFPWAIEKDSTLPLNVKADIPYQSHAKDLEKAMQIIFTLDWLDRIEPEIPEPPVEPDVNPDGPTDPQTPVVPPETTYEVNKTSYIPYGETKDKAHTIYWANGITPPTMPGQINQDGSIVDKTKADFTMVNSLGNAIDPSNKPGAFEYYLAPFDATGNWYDINKTFFYDPNRGVQDQNYCWAAAASNSMSHWVKNHSDKLTQVLDIIKENNIQQHEGLADPELLRPMLNKQSSDDPGKSPVYEHIRQIFYPAIGDVGNQPIHAFETFFNGYEPIAGEQPRNPETFDQHKTNKSGMLHPVFETSPIGYKNAYTPYNEIGPIFKDYFEAGYSVILGYKILSSYHAVSVWGAEYDANGNLCALYLTDSNDGSKGDTALPYVDWQGTHHMGSMIRYNAYEYTKAGQYQGRIAIGTQYIPNSKGGAPIDHICLLAPGDKELDYFIKNHTSLHKNGEALISFENFLDPMNRKK